MKRRIIASLIITVLIAGGMAGSVLAKPVINADSTYYDVNTGLYILKGNVYVAVNNRIITAGQAKVSLSSLEVWGSGGITLTEDDINLAADRVYVSGSQSKSVVEGQVTFKRNGLLITADRGEFNWKTKLGVFSGNVQVTRGGNVWNGNSAEYNVTTNQLQCGT